MNRLSFLMILAFAVGHQVFSQQNRKEMKLNAGIITDRIQESKAFYLDNLGFEVVFENEFYLLLQTPGGQTQLSFLLPNHPTQHPLFQSPFQGKGIYLTIEVEDVDALYEEIQSKSVAIKFELKDEPWGDRHFAIQDPNGVGIDLVRYTAPK